MPDLYSELSKEIHGFPWSGPSVLAHLEVIDGESEKEFIKCFIGSMNLDIIPATVPLKSQYQKTPALFTVSTGRTKRGMKGKGKGA